MKHGHILLVFILSTSTFKYVLTKNFQLLILHNNDMHGRFEETSQRYGKCKEEDKKINNCVGGFARVAHVIRKARKAAKEGIGPNVLYLNAGDTFTGSEWFSVHHWKIVTEFLNLLQPDAVSFGNHEFDGGMAWVVPYVNGVRFPIVAANLDLSQNPQLLATNVSKSIVLEVAGTKIGVIGYLTPETAFISLPESIIFNDEVQSVKKESERLDNQGVKIIIALGHSGFHTDQKIAREVPLVDVVIGGHTNTFLWNGRKPSLEEPEGDYPSVVVQRNRKRVPVVQAYAYTKYMGQLNILFDQNGEVLEFWGQPLLLDKSNPQDPDVLSILNKYRPEVDALNSKVGRSLVVLDGSVESCRYKECNFGNVIADAFVAYHAAHYKGQFWTDAPIGIINGGAIRNTIEPNKADGTVTRGQLLAALPFADPVVTMTLSGADLLKSLEIGARSNGEASHGELLQVSGIRYRIDVSKPVGSRVVEANARCGSCHVQVYKPILSRETYRVITTEFMSNGGDGHSVFKQRGVNKSVEAAIDIDIVAWYMKNTTVSTKEDGRLIVLGRKWRVS